LILISQIFEKVKGINNLQNVILSKLNELTECKDVEDKEEQKKKMEEIFEKNYRKATRYLGTEATAIFLNGKFWKNKEPHK